MFYTQRDIMVQGNKEEIHGNNNNKNENKNNNYNI